MPIFFVHTPELLRIAMTASSATARILAFAVLLLSLAPLGSFYVLFCSITGKVVVENVSKVDPAGTAAAVFISMDNTMARVLQDPNATLEEIWGAILSSHPWNNNNNNDGSSTATLAAVFPIHEAAARQLTMVLPWLISLFFGIVLPAVVSIVSFLWGHRMRQQQQQQEELYGPDAAVTQEKRRLRLERKLKHYTKILNRPDGLVFCDHDKNNNDDNGPKLLEESEEKEMDSTIIPKLHDVSTSSEETFMEEMEESSLSNDMDDTVLLQFKIPKPGFALPSSSSSSSSSSSHNSSFSSISISSISNNNNKRRLAEAPSDYRIIRADSCAICLHPYKTGDAVTWSPNASCIHCFHEKCIVTWLIRKPSKQQACPCCRQNFIRPQLSHDTGQRRHGMRQHPY